MARREWNVARNGQFGRQAKSAGFRRNPQQHAGTGANRQKKAPTDNSWGSSIGGGTRNRTGVRFPKRIAIEPASVRVFGLMSFFPRERYQLKGDADWGGEVGGFGTLWKMLHLCLGW